jgi:FdhD protein
MILVESMATTVLWICMGAERMRDVRVTALSPPGAPVDRDDCVAREEPLEIRLGGQPLAVVMRTPGDDIDLAAGFLKAEMIIRHADDVATIRHCTDASVENVIDVRLSEERKGSAEAMLKTRMAERSTVTSASCGVCGKRSIESLHADVAPFCRAVELDPTLIAALPARLRRSQEVFDKTGGLHAAAIFDAGGSLLALFEDVGRHNAVDKCVGHLLLRESLPRDGILVVSGRTSFEIVQKALVAGIQTIAAVSAPSSLAVELARASNMSLFGFVRDGSLNVYASARTP